MEMQSKNKKNMSNNPDYSFQLYQNLGYWVTSDFEMGKCFYEPGLCMKV